MTSDHTPIIAVVGPTASGKSDLALTIAQDLPALLGTSGEAELVSADAMQLYRGMDIGTAKTPLEERRGITHHQIDVLDVTDEASVAAYQREGRRDIADIHRRAGIAVVAGGSGLYVRALLDVIDFPGTDPDIRARIEAEGDGPLGVQGLWDKLCERDPLAASRIDPHNARRIVRALEVIELTGEPFSARLPRYEFVQPAVMLGMRREPARLDERIAVRTHAMFDEGLLDEVAHLIPLGLREGKTASRATGYAQALSVLDGHMSRDEAIESVALATRQLARRQIKWFRRDPRIMWIDADGCDEAALRANALKLIERALSDAQPESF